MVMKYQNINKIKIGNDYWTGTLWPSHRMQSTSPVEDVSGMIPQDRESLVG